MKKISILCYCIIALAAFAAWAPNAGAWNDGLGGVSNCVGCHPIFAGGAGSVGHQGHLGLNPIDNCNLCHMVIGDTPSITTCAQCHVIQGLPLHHNNQGVADCTPCHPTGFPVPGAESDEVPGYALINPDPPIDPCDGSEERFESNTVSLDNDGDLCYDGEDSDCGAVLPCDTGEPGICADGTLSCTEGVVTCVPVNDPVAEICDDMLDNDCDGLTDCDDPDCDADPACDPCAGFVPEPTTCGIGECASTGETTCDPATGEIGDTCVPGDPSPEVCTGGLDEDCDGLTDCDDDDCGMDPACVVVGKVTLCHKGKNTISVGADAVAAHLAHGDTIGPCPE
jgi:hypothetical protein